METNGSRTVPDDRINSQISTPWPKKACLGFLVATVVGVSLINGILAMRATYWYAVTGYPWYEWGNYFWLSLFLLLCPPLSLLFLDSIHVRRLLRLFLFGMALSKIPEVFEGPFKNLDSLFLYERPLNAIYLAVEFIALFFCWLFLLRQVRGKSLLPIPVTTDRRGRWSFWRNLKNFIRHPVKKNKNLVNIVLLINCVCIAGVFVTMLPENQHIRLERPEGHPIRLNFWAGDPDNYENFTLDLLAKYNVEVYCWMNKKEALEWSQHNVSNYVVKDMPSGSDIDKDAKFYEELDEWMDYADENPEMRQYFKGFVSDDEGLRTIARYDTGVYEHEIAKKQELIAYINARGYNYGMTTILSNIGDLYDGDRNMDIVYCNPFDPQAYANITQWNWMVYRSETAVIYDEPYEYFTYQWATHIRDYMQFIEDQQGLSRGTWLNRTGMSIGVSSGNLYTYSTEVRGQEVALDELLQDAKICHACGIGDITIFYLSHFTKNYGEEGLQTFLEELYSYQSVEFSYKRRATYFGNLKWASNVNGSVFGLFFCDGLYEQWVGILALVWMITLVGISVLFAKRADKWGFTAPEILGKAGAASDIERLQETDMISTGLRVAFIGLLALVLIWAFLVAEIFIFSKEIVYWAPRYWEKVAMEEDWFVEFWATFISVYIYLLVAVLVALVAVGLYFRKWLDQRWK